MCRSLEYKKKGKQLQGVPRQSLPAVSALCFAFCSRPSFHFLHVKLFRTDLFTGACYFDYKLYILLKRLFSYFSNVAMAAVARHFYNEKTEKSPTYGINKATSLPKFRF